MGLFPYLDNCIRQEKGYCRIKYGASSIAPPDAFAMDTVAGGSAIAAGGVAAGVGYACPLAYVSIPNASENGITPFNSVLSNVAYQSEWCGSNIGVSNAALPASVVCKFFSDLELNILHLYLANRTPFHLGVWTHPATALGTGGTGFNMDYSQVSLAETNYLQSFI